MHIVMVSDHECLGGAATAASRLAEGLCGRHRVTRLVLFPENGPHPWQTVSLNNSRRLVELARRGARKFLGARFPLPGTSGHADDQLRRALATLRPDVINLHNLHGGAAWGWTAHFARVASEFAPVVWTLHDMWSFTGRCAYSYDCRDFITGCNASCPTSHEEPRLEPERIEAAWQSRRELFDGRRLTAVTPSRWLAGEARAGFWARHHVEVIPYGIPTEIFRPIDRAEARRRLGLDVSGPVALLVAHNLNERRKGAEIVADLLPCLRRRPLTILTMGGGEMAPPDNRINWRALGWVADQNRQALVYNAADLLIHPAPVDNFPNVVLEALACGTPIAALPVGGLPEMVRPGQTGWLAQDPTAQALGRTVDEAIETVEVGCAMRARCRSEAENKFSLETQARRYEYLFTELSRSDTSSVGGGRCSGEKFEIASRR